MVYMRVDKNEISPIEGFQVYFEVCIALKGAYSAVITSKDSKQDPLSSIDLKIIPNKRASECQATIRNRTKLATIYITENNQAPSFFDLQISSLIALIQ